MTRRAASSASSVDSPETARARGRVEWERRRASRRPQAAELLTVKPSTLLAWARDGRVPVVRLGPRHLRWTRPMLRRIRDEALDPGERI